MKSFIAISLLLISTSSLAKPDCNKNPDFPACKTGAPGLFAAVPEPSTLALLGIGFAGLIAARKRKG